MTRQCRVDLTACVTGPKEHQAEHLCTQLLYMLRQADREILFGVIMVLSMSKLWWDDPLYLNGFVVGYASRSGENCWEEVGAFLALQFGFWEGSRSPFRVFDHNTFYMLHITWTHHSLKWDSMKQSWNKCAEGSQCFPVSCELFFL